MTDEIKCYTVKELKQIRNTNESMVYNMKPMLEEQGKYKGETKEEIDRQEKSLHFVETLLENAENLEDDDEICIEIKKHKS